MKDVRAKLSMLWVFATLDEDWTALRLRRFEFIKRGNGQKASKRAPRSG